MPFKDFSIEEARASDVNTYLMNQMVITCTSSTRPPSPVEGMHIWETDTKALFVRAGASWRLLNSIPIWVYKTGVESVVNSTTLQDDDHLKVVVHPKSAYLWYLSIKVQGPQSVGIRLSWSIPSGATINWSTQAPWIAQTSSEHATISINSLSVGSAADIATMDDQFNPTHYVIVGTCITGNIGGTVQLRWAQTTANPTACSVVGNVVSNGAISTLVFHRVA